MDSWTEMSAADLGRGIARGDIDPLALTQHFLARIAAHPHKDRIFTVVTADRAIAEATAAASRAQAGARLSPLDGVPISWKDLFDSAGTATEAGSALLAGRRPDADAAVLGAATAMGLVCLGKTHMSELAFSGLGLNPITATSPNVNDPGAVPGGSSSGAAASVAFGLAAAAIGSDTGGSVRIPAAWNDLVGLKTTSGRISLQGVVPLAARFDTVGPLCRTVEDAALLLAALEGGQAIDLSGTKDLAGRRFAILKTIADADLRAAPRAAFTSALERLQNAGAEVVTFEFPDLALAYQEAGPLFPGEAYGTWRDQIEAAPDKMYPPILDRFRAGRDFSAPDFVAAWRRIDAIRADWAKATAEFDAVVCATSPIMPPNIDRLMNDEDYYVTENLMALRNTRVGNLMGTSAITLPTGVPSCGIQLIGPPMGEEALLRLAVSVERALA
ncbi:MAG: amidase family protein [Rhodobacteraceae bacterium]|nr:amidase family protein [Paracoccaceae bacterium]